MQGTEVQAEKSSYVCHVTLERRCLMQARQQRKSKREDQILLFLATGLKTKLLTDFI